MPEVPPHLPPPTDRRGKSLPLWSIVLTVLACVMFFGGFAFVDKHYNNTPQEWKNTAGMVVAFIGAPLSLITSWVFAMIAIFLHRSCLAWVALLISMATMGLIVLLVWAGLEGLSAFR